jgi:type IV fimbrial biogenesis protein FimT
MPAPGTSVPAFRRCGGFSLAESLVIVGLLALVTAVAVPAYESATHSMRLSSITNAFVAHLQLTRSEAIKRNARVVTCKSASRAACAAGGGWEQGWIVFHDPNNNGALDAGEPVIGSYSTLPTGYRLTGNGLVAAYLSFNGMGLTKSTSGAFQAGTLTLCREGDPALRGHEIVINILGRPRIRKATLAVC